MMMNAVFTRLRLPALTAAPVQPPQNSYRVFAVEFDPDALDLLQRLLDVEIQKHLFDFQDKFCRGTRINELMWLDSLVPHDDSQVIVTALEYQHFQAYLSSRMLLMLKYEESILTDVPMDTLWQSLVSIRDSFLNATAIVSLDLPLLTKHE